MESKHGVHRQMDEFTRYAVQLAHDTCSGIYGNARDYPIDQEGEEQIRFYAEILYRRGLWIPLDTDAYNDRALGEEAGAIYQRWTTHALERVCDEFCIVVNEIIDAQARKKTEQKSFYLPNFFTQKRKIKEKISSMLSEEIAIYEEKD